MSKQDSSARDDDIAVPLEQGAPGCHITVSDYLLSTEEIRIAHCPVGETPWGSATPEAVSAFIGQTGITLTPRVWADFIVGLSKMPAIAGALAELAGGGEAAS